MEEKTQKRLMGRDVLLERTRLLDAPYCEEPRMYGGAWGGAKIVDLRNELLADSRLRGFYFTPKPSPSDRDKEIYILNENEGGSIKVYCGPTRSRFNYLGARVMGEIAQRDLLGDCLKDHGFNPILRQFHLANVSVPFSDPSNMFRKYGAERGWEYCSSKSGLPEERRLADTDGKTQIEVCFDNIVIVHDLDAQEYFSSQSKGVIEDDWQKDYSLEQLRRHYGDGMVVAGKK